jgi:hypothetical protein
LAAWIQAFILGMLRIRAERSLRPGKAGPVAITESRTLPSSTQFTTAPRRSKRSSVAPLAHTRHKKDPARLLPYRSIPPKSQRGPHGDRAEGRVGQAGPDQSVLGEREEVDHRGDPQCLRRRRWPQGWHDLRWPKGGNRGRFGEAARQRYGWRYWECSGVQRISKDVVPMLLRALACRQYQTGRLRPNDAFADVLKTVFPGNPQNSLVGPAGLEPATRPL